MTPDTVPLDSNRILAQALSLQDAALSQVLRTMNAVTAQTLYDLKEFLCSLAFYLGCSRLHHFLEGLHAPLCYPNPFPQSERSIAFDSLIDITLAISNTSVPVGNSLDAADTRLFIITGANQGGKSTFLRSIGLAHIMMRSGMFVAAASFSAGISSQVFTHFCRPEDARIRSGKLDEELIRINAIVERLEPDALLLMNESFSSTSESEGTSIALALTKAMYALNIRTYFVTHLYDYAQAMYEQKQMSACLFLSAQRDDTGCRSYKIIEGMPIPTSYGMDLYRQIVQAESPTVNG